MSRTKRNCVVAFQEIDNWESSEVVGDTGGTWELIKGTHVRSPGLDLPCEMRKGMRRKVVGRRVVAVVVGHIVCVCQ